MRSKIRRKHALRNTYREDAFDTDRFDALDMIIQKEIQGFENSFSILWVY